MPLEYTTICAQASHVYTGSNQTKLNLIVYGLHECLYGIGATTREN